MAQPGTPAALSNRRWVILSVVAVAQLMVVFDATIVNIALPSAQRALAFTVPLPVGPNPSIHKEKACPASPRPSRPTTCHAS